VRAYEKTHTTREWSPGDLCKVNHEKGYARPPAPQVQGAGLKLYNDAAGPFVVVNELEDRPGTFKLRHKYMGTLTITNHVRMEPFGGEDIMQAAGEFMEDGKEDEDLALFKALYPKAVLPTAAPGARVDDEVEEVLRQPDVYELEEILDVNEQEGPSWKALCKWKGYDETTWQDHTSFHGLGVDGQEGYTALYTFYNSPQRWHMLPKLPQQIRVRWSQYKVLRNRHAQAAKRLNLNPPRRRRHRK
jgi:hypothetical protein